MFHCLMSSPFSPGQRKLQLPHGPYSTCNRILCCLFIWLSILKPFISCEPAGVYVVENTTVYANESAVMGTIDHGPQMIYKLRVDKCVAKASTLVIAFETVPVYSGFSQDTQIAVGYFLVLVNTLGHIPQSASEEGTFMARTGTWIQELRSCGNFTRGVDELSCRQSYAIMRIPLLHAQIDNLSWYVGVSSIGASSRFQLQAWCAGEINEAEENQENSLCVRVGTTRCMGDFEHNVCAADRIPLPGNGGRTSLDALSVDHGDWKYFIFDVPNYTTRILVEMMHINGDAILFVKPDQHDSSSNLPTEFDINEYADKYAFQNRLHLHHCSMNGSGRYYIGVYNNDACVEEASSFNLTISTLSMESSNKLCPANCSYPHGKCIADNVCQCKEGYGGIFCEGSLVSPRTHQSITGHLLPGQIAYFQLDHEELQSHNVLSVKFARNASNTVLLAKAGGFPTLTNYSMKLADISDNSNVSYLLEEHKIRSDDFSDNLIFAVFNVDFVLHQVSMYDIIVDFPGGKRLSSGIILMSALFSSFSVFFLVLIIKRFLWCACYGYNTQASRSSGDVLIQEELKKSVIESFSLLSFKDGILPKGETVCAVCLNDYVTGENLRELPACFHVFHADCIDKWLLCKLSCPVCRTMLPMTKNGGSCQQQ